MNNNPDPKLDLNTIRSDYKKEGIALFRYSDQELHSYPYDTPWIDDPEFSRLYNKIRDHTLVDRVRCYSLHIIAQQVRDLEGDVLEIGVWRGGTAAIFASQLPNKTVFLADTFHGVTKSSEWEHYQDGAHSDTSIDAVHGFLRDSLGVTNYEILPGIFPEESFQKVEGRKWAFVHIDVDVYRSAKDAFLRIWDNVVAGGVIVFDDYGFFSACEGIRKFIDEIKNDSDKLFIHNMNAHAYIIKRN